MARPTYQHVVSIGYFCSTALELERLGFRDASYPLDWVICPLKPTLALLESGFEDFVRPQYLSRNSTYGHVVHDVESGIDFYHDFSSEQTVEAQVDSVQEKYQRRIRRWLTAITEPTLFVRYIENSDELEYLEHNMEEVLLLLRRSNPLNGLLLVGNSDMPATCAGIDVFRVEADEGDTVARQFVEKNLRLRLKLLGLRYPLRLRMANYMRYARGPHGKERRRAVIRRLASLILTEKRLARLAAEVRGNQSNA